jgi:hypothetical protein
LLSPSYSVINLISFIIFGRKWDKLSESALEILDLEIQIAIWLNNPLFEN